MGMGNSNYWKDFFYALRSVHQALRLTFRHLRQTVNRTNSNTRIDITHSDYFKHQKGITTVNYPSEKLPVPEVGRYKLDVEMDDCIVCDQCVKICPVDCITIEPIRAPAEFGKTSDGTAKKIHAARFDIDMAKCCFCGLCTTVCPTECLTMTDEYAFSTYELKEHQFAFGILSEAEILTKKKEWEDYLATKSASIPQSGAGSAPKPVIKPARPKIGN
jgi:formate hydrogenlyase subunit 6/NADH:ubiquinone oxidoreductase subunit I